MKLHKSKAYTRAGKDYFTWKVNLSGEHVEAMGWKHGQELEARPGKAGLLLRPLTEAKE